MINLLGERLIITICLHHLRLYSAKEPAYIALPPVAPDNERHERSLIEIREFQRNSDTCRHSGKGGAGASSL